MTHELYILLLTMTGDPNASAAVNLAATAAERMSLEQRKDWCKKTKIAPKIPPGMMFAKYSFWAQFQTKLVWEVAWGVVKANGDSGRKDRLAAWLRERREDAIRLETAWPPKPVFRPVYELPQVRTDFSQFFK